MRNKQVARQGLTAVAAIALCTMSFSLLAAQESKWRLVQTNNAGDSLSVIDPATNKVVGEIKGIEAAHGVVAAKDGSRIYVSEEADRTLDVVDGKTLQVTKKIPLSGVPNLIAPTPDGRFLYVAIALAWDDVSDFPQIKAAPSGGIDIIDTASLANVKTIPIKGGIHDLNVTPDGKYVVAGAVRAAKPPANLMNVIDTRTNEIAWTLSISPAPSPMAIMANPDGSTKSIFAQGAIHGFSVVDFATHVRTNVINLPTIPAAQQNPFGGASHGIAVTADQKTLLVNSSRNNTLYAYSLPDLTLIGGAALGGKGANWLTISPDDKTAYVANPQTNDVSVVDIKSLKEVARIPVGFAPSRNTAWLTP
jgi:YVTN family beta-propeller protein